MSVNTRNFIIKSLEFMIIFSGKNLCKFQNGSFFFNFIVLNTL